MPRVIKRGVSQDLADRLFPTLSEEELNESIMDIPPEQRRLQTETIDFSVSTILDYLEAKSIYIPEFQRRYVWSAPQASRLIESLIIQCPIPVIYLNQGSDEKLSVIDGNQRLLSLRKYIKNNEFELKGLTAYPELEGLKFFQLDARIQRHILNRTLRCIVISKGTHPQIKFDVFERLNSGSVKLSPQELRHGIYHGNFMKFVTSLGQNKIWKRLMSSNADNKRMKGEELIIRFFALHFNLPNYKKPLAHFLNDYCDKNKDISDEVKENFYALFMLTIQNVDNLYGELAFKIFDTKLRPINKFNAALFDAEMLSLSQYDDVIDVSKATSNNFVKELSNLFAENEDFIKTISLSTSDKNNITKRIKIISKLVEKYV